MTIQWRTENDTDARVRYGDGPSNLTQTVDDLALEKSHMIALTGLTPATTYYYSIGTTTTALAGGDDDHYFRTAPVTGTTARIRAWVIGDSGTQDQNARNVLDAYLAHPGSNATDVWLMLGDNAYLSGTEVQYQAAVFDQYPMLLRNTILWTTRGNHDILHAGPDNDYYDFFALPTAAEAGGVASGTEAYHSFNFANVHFVCLDSEGSDRSPAGPMITWLQQDLAANTTDWCIAYWHHPPYTKGSHDSDNVLDSEGRMTDMRENVLPILENFAVDLVLSGHSHSYERSFLLNGHYGTSETLAESMKIDAGDGRISGDGAYSRPTEGVAPNEGAIYTVTGSSGITESAPLNHPVMITSLAVLGSLVLDIDGLRMDATFIDTTGVSRDEFTIVKGNATGTKPIPEREATDLRLAGCRPNPFGVDTMVEFVTPTAGHVRLRVLDVKGRSVASLVDDDRSAGRHVVQWRGRTSRDQPAAPGVYFVVLEQGNDARVVKVVRTH